MEMQETETLLAGGNVNTVVRRGNTVRRATGAWSHAVHALLLHLERACFDSAPRYLGKDEQGREILTFLPGEVGFGPHVWSSEALPLVAKLLRRLHDATAGFAPPPDAAWQLVYPDATQHEVICHNDFAPYNLVFQEGRPIALIDFDMAGPGPRRWDLAFALYYFAPLSFSGDLRELALADLEQGSPRLHTFCRAYGAEPTLALLDTVKERLDVLCTTLLARAEAGEAAFQKMVDEGHLAHYQREVAAFHTHRAALERNISRTVE